MKVLLAVGSVVIVLIIIFFSIKSNTKPQEEFNPKSATSRQTGKPASQPTALENHAYVPFSDGVLEKTADKRRVLFFFANWCPTCKPADENFSANIDKIPEDVVLVKVNYNDSETDEKEKMLAKKYGVTYQHTFVQIDGSGNKLKIWNGGQTGELLANLE